MAKLHEPDMTEMTRECRPNRSHAERLHAKNSNGVHESIGIFEKD
jgi:hypothetical protein